MSIHHSISENGSGLWTFQNHSDVHLEFYADGTTIVVFDDPEEGNPKMRSLMTNEDTINAYKKDSESLRESVRRLVGEWREKQANQSAVGDRYADRENQPLASLFYRESDAIKVCADELSALIDGKDGGR